jgi:hypothetical protein
VEKRALRDREIVSEYRCIVLMEISPQSESDADRILNIDDLTAGLKELGQSIARQRQIQDESEAVSETVAEIINDDLIPVVYANDPGTYLGIYQGLALSLPFSEP